MINGYYYQTPIMNYVNTQLIIAVTAIIAAILGAALFFTFFRKKNEGKFHGIKGKLYNLMNLNRFYAEEILRFVYIVLTCVVTVTGIVTIILGSFLMGLIELVVVNVALRVVFELLMMFIIMCRKTVTIDKKLSNIEKYYDDGYDAYCTDESGTCSADEEEDEDGAGVSCSGSCEGCTSDCGPDDIPF